jgi:hypothetical protein
MAIERIKHPAQLLSPTQNKSLILLLYPLSNLPLPERESSIVSEPDRGREFPLDLFLPTALWLWDRLSL